MSRHFIRYRILEILYQDPGQGWRAFMVIYEGRCRNKRLALKSYCNPRGTSLLRASRLESLSVCDLGGYKPQQGYERLTDICSIAIDDRELSPDYYTEQSLGRSLLEQYALKYTKTRSIGPWDRQSKPSNRSELRLLA